MKPEEHYFSNILTAVAAAPAEVLTNFKEIETTFKNGDKLSLELCVGTKFYKLEQGDVFQLTYAERCEGSYDDKPAAPGVHYYMTCNTEYFPVTQEGLGLALAAYMHRLVNNKAFESSGLGVPLKEIFKPAEEQPA